jgi:hypothetical protein
VAASVVSLAWLVLGFVYARGMFSGGLDVSTPNGVAQIALLSIAMAAPVLFFFTLAALFRRAQEMRVVARSMTQVAIRLAEPDKTSLSGVSALGEAVRREIAAMDSGMERVLARAGELEAGVRGEVLTLERAYQDNEARLRALIDDLKQ